MHSQAKGANLRSGRANAAVPQEARAGLIYRAHNEYGIQVADVTAGQSQGLYLRQLSVRRLGRYQSPQGAESRVHAAQRRSHFFSRAPASQQSKKTSYFARSEITTSVMRPSRSLRLSRYCIHMK